MDPTTRSVTVRAELPNEELLLKPGLLMTVDVMTNAREAVGIPEEALLPEGDRNSVFVLDSAKEPSVLERREVEIGQRRDGLAEITSGLRAGEKVVTRGGMTLGPGAAVSVLAEADGDESLKELLRETGGADE